VDLGEVQAGLERGVLRRGKDGDDFGGRRAEPQEEDESGEMAGSE